MKFKKGTEKIVIELVVPSIIEGHDNGMSHTKEVVKRWIDSPDFHYTSQLPEQNYKRVFKQDAWPSEFEHGTVYPKAKKLSRRERVLLDPLSASQKK